jgi:hypothetical protein
MNKKIVNIENILRFLPGYMIDDYMKEKIKKERLKKYKNILKDERL